MLFKCPEKLLLLHLAAYGVGFLNRLLYGQEQLELGRQLVLRVEAIGEVHSTDATICVYLDTECLHIVRSVGATGEVGQIKLDLVPTLIQSHGHCANEWLDASGRLVVAGPKSAPHVLVVENLLLGEQEQDSQHNYISKQRKCSCILPALQK